MASPLVAGCSPLAHTGFLFTSQRRKSSFGSKRVCCHQIAWRPFSFYLGHDLCPSQRVFNKRFGMAVCQPQNAQNGSLQATQQSASQKHISRLPLQGSLQIEANFGHSVVRLQSSGHLQCSTGTQA